MYLTHANEAQIGKIGLSIGIPVGKTRELNKVFSAVKGQCYQPFIQHRESHRRAFEVKGRFREDCLAG